MVARRDLSAVDAALLTGRPSVHQVLIGDLMQNFVNENYIPPLLALIEAGAPVDELCAGGSTALWRAVERGRPDFLIRELVDARADTNFQMDGIPLLCMAAERGASSKCLRLLIQGCARLSSASAPKWGARPALSLAAARGHPYVVRTLLRAGAPVDARDGNGATALMHAAELQDRTVVRLLLTHGADPNCSDINGNLFAHMAAAKNDVHSLRMAERRGAVLTAKNLAGCTPLDFAEAKSDGRAARFLRKHQAHSCEHGGSEQLSLF
jgi:ankyrin repeat protein